MESAVEVDEVAEHDREMSALGGVQRQRHGRHRCSNVGCRCPLPDGFEIGNRTQQLAAMTEQDAQLLEILICQIRNDVKINSVIAKRLRVLLQTDLVEPAVDVQANPLAHVRGRF